MDKLSKINVGIPKLNERLGGGFLENSVVLISLQTASRLIELGDWELLDIKGKKVFIILVEYDRPVDTYLNIARLLNFKKEEVKNGSIHISLDNVKIINCYSSVFEDENHLFEDAVHTLDDPFNTDKLYSAMRIIREGMPEDTWVVWVFDSLTGLSIGVPENELAKFFGRAIRLHKKYGDIAFYVINMDAHTPQFLATITHLVDTVINFKVEETENKLKGYVQIVKSPLIHDTTKLYYDVHPDGSIIFY